MIFIFFSDNSKFFLGEVESLGVTRLHINHLKGLVAWPKDNPAVCLAADVMVSGQGEENIKGAAIVLAVALQQLIQWKVVILKWIRSKVEALSGCLPRQDT